MGGGFWHPGILSLLGRWCSPPLCGVFCHIVATTSLLFVSLRLSLAHRQCYFLAPNIDKSCIKVFPSNCSSCSADQHWLTSVCIGGLFNKFCITHLKPACISEIFLTVIGKQLLWEFLLEQYVKRLSRMNWLTCSESLRYYGLLNTILLYPTSGQQQLWHTVLLEGQGKKQNTYKE